MLGNGVVNPPRNYQPDPMAPIEGMSEGMEPDLGNCMVGVMESIWLRAPVLTVL